MSVVIIQLFTSGCDLTIILCYGMTLNMQYKEGFQGLYINYHVLAECPPYGQVPAYRKPVSRSLASFELSAQVATEAGCYNDGKV